jgi:biotin transport system substrate-specific component
MNGLSVFSANRPITDRKADAVIGVFFFTLATILSSYVRIPVYGSPVPITLQTFFAILSGAVLGKKLGALSQAGYILLSSALGVSYVAGPTGGYMIGFIAASYTVGSFIGKGGVGTLRTVLSFIAGNALIYLFGMSWLVLLYGFNPVNAFSMGALPFIGGDAIKVSLAFAVYLKIRGRVGSIFR